MGCTKKTFTILLCGGIAITSLILQLFFGCTHTPKIGGAGGGNLGEALDKLIKENKMADAQSLIGQAIKMGDVNADILHFRAGHLFITNKSYAAAMSQLAKVKDDIFFKSPKLMGSLYYGLPKKEQAELVKLMAERGFFAARKESVCPYFELAERREHGRLVADILKKHEINASLTEASLNYLYVKLPETVELSELSAINGFDSFAKATSADDEVARMNTLLIFGKNQEAVATFNSIKPRRSSFDDLQWCRIAYVEGKILKAMRRYRDARQKFQELAETCTGDVGMNARYLDLQLAAKVSDDQALGGGRFESFVADYPGHGFSDDVLLFQANLLFDLKKNDQALTVLDRIIHEYPHGDMWERAWFLKAFELARRGNHAGALASLKGLAAKSSPGTLANAQARYWRARLDIFPELTKLRRASGDKRTALGELKQLAYVPHPTIYSWLSLALLQQLKEPITLSKAAVSEPKNYEKPASLRLVFELLTNGFYDYAQALLDEKIPSNDQESLAMAMGYAQMGAFAAGHRNLVRCNTSAGKAIMKSAPTIYQKIAYPVTYEAEIDAAIKRSPLPKALVLADVREESGFLRDALSWAGARGLMQLMYDSGKDAGKKMGMNHLEPEHLFYPKTNLELGTSILHTYWQQFGHVVPAIASYNAGPGQVRRWLGNQTEIPTDTFFESITYKETYHYVARVLGSTFVYSALHNAPLPPLATTITPK